MLLKRLTLINALLLLSVLEIQFCGSLSIDASGGSGGYSASEGGSDSEEECETESGSAAESGIGVKSGGEDSGESGGKDSGESGGESGGVSEGGEPGETEIAKYNAMTKNYFSEICEKLLSRSEKPVSGIIGGLIEIIMRINMAMEMGMQTIEIGGGGMVLIMAATAGQSVDSGLKGFNMILDNVFMVGERMPSGLGGPVFERLRTKIATCREKVDAPFITELFIKSSGCLGSQLGAILDDVKIIMEKVSVILDGFSTVLIELKEKSLMQMPKCLMGNVKTQASSCMSLGLGMVKPAWTISLAMPKIGICSGKIGISVGTAMASKYTSKAGCSVESFAEEISSGLGGAKDKITGVIGGIKGKMDDLVSKIKIG